MRKHWFYGWPSGLAEAVYEKILLEWDMLKEIQLHEYPCGAHDRLIARHKPGNKTLKDTVAIPIKQVTYRNIIDQRL